jgi:hypothetical protein
MVKKKKKSNLPLSRRDKEPRNPSHNLQKRSLKRRETAKRRKLKEFMLFRNQVVKMKEDIKKEKSS